MALGTNTDPYQPIDERYQITREILEGAARFPSSRRHRHEIEPRAARHRYPGARWRRWDLAQVALSVTTLDRKLARAMEPRAPTPERRIEAIRELAKAGIPTAVMPAPMIPALNDHEMEAILERRARGGRANAGYVASAPAA